MTNKSIDSMSDNIKIDGHKGTWYVIDNTVINNKEVFLLEHETYGDDAACIIVDKNCNLLLNDVWNGFDDYMEYLEANSLEKLLSGANNRVETTIQNNTASKHLDR